MPKPHEEKEFWLTRLRQDGAVARTAFEEALGQETGLSAAVPSCPDWTLLDLLHHLAGVYLFVRSHVSRGVTSHPTDDPRDDLGDLPTGPAAVQWLADEHAALVTLLAGLDPQMAAWHWAPAPKQVRFWHRRMAHETAVHRWDAQVAVGQVEPIESALAVDGVSEVLDSWLPSGRWRGPVDRQGLVRLVATDAEHEWFIRLRGEGVALLDTDSWLDPEARVPRVTARGSASDLQLALWGRVPFDVLEINGEVDLLPALRTD